MIVDVATKEDLLQLKAEILEEIRLIFRSTHIQAESNWLRSSQVRNMLAISPGTLQNLRVKGLLRYTKLGGTFFYSTEDINHMLSKKSSWKIDSQ